MITEDGALEMAYWDLHETRLKYRKLFFELNCPVSGSLTLEDEIKGREHALNEMCRCLYKMWVLQNFINRHENRTVYSHCAISCPWWWRDKGESKWKIK